MRLRRVPRAVRTYGALGVVGALIAIVAAMAGLPYGRLNYSAFAELYHQGTDTSGEIHLALDCAPSAAGTQDLCVYNPNFPPAIGVAVTLGNSTGTPFVLGSFLFRVYNPGQPQLDALTIDNPGSFDDNPNFNDGGVTGTWICDQPPPSDDYTPEPPEDSFILCFDETGDGPTVAATSDHLTLASIAYGAPIFGSPGDIVLTIFDGAIYDDTFAEVGSCHPIIEVEMECFGATIRFEDQSTPPPPTFTPTATPTVAPGCFNDHDCDGFKNPPPPRHLGPQNTDTNFDNCFTPPNPDQLNGDGNFIDQSPPWMVDDRTSARSDGDGDRCDGDLDNDGLFGSIFTDEAACNGSGTPDKYNGDTDGDRVMDGAECALGTNPTDPLSKPAFPPAVDDPDHDRLSTAFEISIGSDPNDIDSDDDGLQDGWEYKGYNTNPTSNETDGDGVKDGCEVASLNTDTLVNPGDQAMLAGEIMRPVPPSQKLANMDLNKDGVINPGDQALQASMAMPGKCPLVTPWP